MQSGPSNVLVPERVPIIQWRTKALVTTSGVPLHASRFALQASSTSHSNLRPLHNFNPWLLVPLQPKRRRRAPPRGQHTAALAAWRVQSGQSAGSSPVTSSTQANPPPNLRLPPPKGPPPKIRPPLRPKTNCPKIRPPVSKSFQPNTSEWLWCIMGSVHSFISSSVCGQNKKKPV